MNYSKYYHGSSEKLSEHIVRSPPFVGVVPMAALLGPLAGIDFRGWCVSAYQVSHTASLSALTYLAALPKDCKLASLHAAMVCSWEEPAYYSVPGFGPFSLAWGWLLLGVGVGSALSALWMSWMGHLKLDPSVGTLAALVTPAPVPEITRVRARNDVLNFIAAGGSSALQELAAASSMTEQALLTAVIGTSGGHARVMGSGRGVHPPPGFGLPL